ncbi:MAG TPA: hypothetical protein VFZ98_06825, partial [Vicinamibacterales bacterium]
MDGLLSAPLDTTAATTATDDPTKPDPRKPAPKVLSGDEWESAQSAPASALQSPDPGKSTTSGLGRVLTGDEWEIAQRFSAPQIRNWKIPAMPMAPRDATRGQFDENGVQHPADDYVTELAKNSIGTLFDPKSPAIVGAAATGPLAALAVGTYVTGSVLANVAQYTYQKYLEVHASPDVRKAMEADPERISGAAAAAQATLLGLGSLVHAGVKGAGAATDVSSGMLEAGAQGVKETNFAPRFSEGFQDATDRSRFAASLERGAAEAKGAAPAPRPKGFEPTAAAPASARVKPVEGLETAPDVKPGRVTPIETQPASAPLQEAADVNAAVRDYQAQRAAEDTQDITADRVAAAERLLGLREEDADRVARETTVMIRRRPRFFESPEGANLLGSVAASRGLPDDASPYPATSPLDEAWKTGHDAVTSV